MNRILLYFSFICTIGLACCTRTPDEKLFVVEDNGLFGYVSESGDTVIPCMYPFVYTDTINHIGFVAEGNGKIVCLDKKGKLAREARQSGRHSGCLSVYFCAACGGGRHCHSADDCAIGFADTMGKVIIPPSYKFAFPFKDGKAKVTYEGQSVSNGEYTVWESSSWTFIDNPLRNEGE